MEAQFKLVVEVHEGKGFINGVTTTTLLVSYGEKKHKLKSKCKSKTTHPICSVDSKHPSPLIIHIIEKEKKNNPWVIKIDAQRLSKLNHTFRESWEVLKAEGVQAKPQIKVKLRVCPGQPNKKPAKISSGLVKKQVSIRSKSGFSVSPLLQLIKDDDALGLEDYLLTITPDEINKQHPKNGNTALHEACIEKREACLPLLLTADGINVDLPNANKNTPLHYFCEHWTSPDYLHSFSLFIKHGANVNAVNSNGETPLFKAIFNPSIRTLLMEALIEHNADVNAVSATKDGVLHYAVRLGRSDLVDMILQAKPKLNIKGGDGFTPYELATKVYNSDEHKKIAEHLSQVAELFTWLEENHLSDFKGLFIRNEILLTLVPDITDLLLQQMGVENATHRANILRACNAYRDKLGTNTPKTTPKKADSKGKAPCVTVGRTKGQTVVAQYSDKNEVVNRPTQGMRMLEQDANLFEKELASLRRNNPNEWIIDHKQLEYLKHLGTGASGDVYKGFYKSQKDGVVECAIKVLKEMSATQEIDEFKKEFEVLSAVTHPNVVYFFGASLQQRLCMVMEYCANETLNHVMKNPSNEFSWEFGIQACTETALGLKALHAHNPQIFHRDLKSLNLLVTHDWHIKVCDFGLSRFNTPENLATFSQMRGTFAYCDPAIYQGKSFCAASDIFSAGIIFWEIANCIIKRQYEQPYSEYKSLTFDFQIIIQAAQENLRPTIPPSCPPALVSLITSCLKTKQDERPSLDSIIKSFGVINDDFNKRTKEWEDTRQKKDQK